MHILSRRPDYITNVHTTPADCYRRMKTGYKHYTYRDYKVADSISECAYECERTSYCRSFSFRHGPTTSSDIGNCLLSDKRGFEIRDQDMVLTTTALGNWDIYDLREGGRSGCGGGGGGSGTRIREGE